MLDAGGDQEQDKALLAGARRALVVSSILHGGIASDP